MTGTMQKFLGTKRGLSIYLQINNGVLVGQVNRSTIITISKRENTSGGAKRPDRARISIRSSQLNLWKLGRPSFPIDQRTGQDTRGCNADSDNQPRVRCQHGCVVL